MYDSRDQTKCQKTTHSTSYHDIVPSLDEYTTIYSSEAFRSGPPDTFAQQSNLAWMEISSWEVADDPNFALDPDSDKYDEAVEGEVMDETPDDQGVSTAAPTAKPKSMRVVT